MDNLRGMYMMRFSCLFFLLLLAMPAYAANVSRTFSRTEVFPGEEITLSYLVSPQNATLWAVDDVLPPQWQVKDTTVHKGHLRWYSQQPSKSYILKAPNQTGIHFFANGSYQIYGDDNWYILHEVEVYVRSCMPSWYCTGYSSCELNDTKRCNGAYDLNECFAKTNLSEDRYSGSYGEFSQACDHDGNGVAGSIDRITTNLEEISVLIDNSSDMDLNFSGKKVWVEFKNGNRTVVKFWYNFTRTLNLANITISTQDADASQGSVLIRGINLPPDYTKTAYLDNKANTNTVCIEDAEISDISEISAGCSEPEESLVVCNGIQQNGYTCTAEGNTYIIEGLRHTGIMEHEAPSEAVIVQGSSGGSGSARVCVANWKCSDWSSCSPDGKATRSCEDLNVCGLERPSELRNCYYYIPKEKMIKPSTAAEPNITQEEEQTDLPLVEEGNLEIPRVTGAAIGTAYRARPVTIGILTLFILTIVGLFIYSHASSMKHWPFHLGFEKKRYVVLVIIILVTFILLLLHFAINTPFS